MSRSLVKNTALNIGGQVVPLIAALVCIPLVIGGMGETLYGVLSLLWVILGSSSVFDLGMSRAATKFVSEAIAEGRSGQIRAIVRVTQWVQLAAGASVALVILVAAPKIASTWIDVPSLVEPDVIAAMRLTGLSIPVVLAMGSIRGVLEAEHRFVLLNVQRAVFSTLTFVLPLVAVTLEWGLTGVAALLLGSRVLQWLVLESTVSLPPAERQAVEGKQAPTLKRLAHFGGWVAVSNLLAPIQENVEKFVLATTLPIASLASFTVPKDVLDRVEILPASVSSALFPRFAASRADQHAETAAQFYRVIAILSLLVSVPLLIMGTSAAPILGLWLGGALAPGMIPVTVCLVIGIHLSALNTVAFALLQAVGRPEVAARQQLFRFPLLIAVSWLGTIKFGVVGAAAAWSIGRGLAFAMNVWAVKRWILGGRGRLLPIETWSAVMAFPAIIGAVTLLHSIAPDSTRLVSIIGVCAAVLMTIAGWQLLLTKSERGALLKLSRLR